MRRLAFSCGIALVGGLLLAVAFLPDPAVRYFAVIAPGLLVIAVRPLRARGAFLAAFVFGLAFFLPHLSWAGSFLGWLPWTALAVYQGLFMALLGPALVAVLRLQFWPIFAACCWVGVEALRSRIFFGGFPWGRLGFSQDGGAFTPWVAYGGVPLLSGVVALCGFLLAAAYFHFRRTGFTRAVTVLVAAAVALPLLGILGWLSIPSGAGAPSAVIAVVQGSVPRIGLDFNAQRRAVLDNHVAETKKLAAKVASGAKPQPTVVIWPENSSDIDPYQNADAAEVIQEAADTIKAPILVGAVVEGPGSNARNMGIMWWPNDDSAHPAGPGQTYVKRHPAPFAEYIPYRAFFQKISSLVDLLQVPFVAGHRVGDFNVPTSSTSNMVIGDVICFEVAYDNLVASTVADGAQVLTVQTNNATFGGTGEAQQQFAMSRIRAVEHSRTVISASTTGITGITLPDGTVTAQSGHFVPAAFSQRVPVMSQITVADRVGEWPEWILCAGAVLGIGFGFRDGRRNRSSQAHGSDDRVSPASEAVIS
ncbi:MAG: apolipoprotein N-acyltransferase [Antricoccus sp.]